MSALPRPRKGNPGDPNCQCRCHFEKGVSHVMACCRAPDTDKILRMTAELLKSTKHLDAVLRKTGAPA